MSLKSSNTCPNRALRTGADQQKSSIGTDCAMRALLLVKLGRRDRCFDCSVEEGGGVSDPNEEELEVTVRERRRERWLDVD